MVEPPEEGGGLLPTAEPEGSDEDDLNDPMVSNPVKPFVIPVVIRNTHTGVGSNQGALIDSGCTQCLIHRSVVDELAIWVVALRTPIRFEQMDGTMLGGAQLHMSPSSSSWNRGTLGIYTICGGRYDD